VLQTPHRTGAHHFRCESSYATRNVADTLVTDSATILHVNELVLRLHAVGEPPRHILDVMHVPVCTY
jgi:hypothetical protein